MESFRNLSLQKQLQAAQEKIKELENEIEILKGVKQRPPVPPKNNPWVKGENFNLTQQFQIAKKDPELAAKMEAEADSYQERLRLHLIAN